MHKKPFDPLIERQGFKTTARTAPINAGALDRQNGSFEGRFWRTRHEHAYVYVHTTVSYSITTHVCILDRYSCMHLSVVLMCAI
jgi:hypothetical protein